ncbi:hypothetical protein Ccrd_012105 [Cynara cardunculus var. scolymus]|uniref:Uncharacterized protein n=1 Tax=Cynara cardunculus var. scolymus TaxID=59895 RepID=A0A118K5R3_CYNCS|nr:hypothetical protein Ccrd_012105 [Cynara cardunculus var. scolymus]
MIWPLHIAVNTLSNSSPGEVTFSPVKNPVPSSSLTNLYNGYDLQALILFGIANVPSSRDRPELVGASASKDKWRCKGRRCMQRRTLYRLLENLEGWSSPFTPMVRTFLATWLTVFFTVDLMFSSKYLKSMDWHRATKNEVDMSFKISTASDVFLAEINPKEFTSWLCCSAL